MTSGQNDPGMRVLILPPTRKDGEITRGLLQKANIACHVCADAAELAHGIAQAAGALLVTEILATAPGVQLVLDALKRQEPWSDLPIVMLLHGGVPSARENEVLNSLNNVTYLERPASTYTVLSAVQAALRARLRQYEIRRLLESEQSARREAERANLIKDEFLATLSHELRTPLNAIFGWAQLLKIDPTDTERVLEAVNVIDRNIRIQTQLIEDLLDMSRIVSGKVRLDVAQVELTEVIEAALQAVGPAIDAKELRLEKVVDPSLGPVSGDFGRLQQVLWNILNNAVKFTPKNGRIHVLGQRVGSHVEISVSDTGEGIDADFLPRLFERFTQADGSPTRRHGGLGLGLSIVKSLVELHGGAVSAYSPGRDQGATFLVRLPIRVTKESVEPLARRRTSEAAPAVAVELEKLDGIKVLVVDDEADSRELVKRFLSEGHALPVLAASAAEAQSLLEKFHPDIIVSDVGMPGEDGYEFMRKARRSGVRAPAIALTAFARAEDRIRSIQAGYQAHLSKPVEPAELLTMIIRLHER